MEDAEVATLLKKGLTLDKSIQLFLESLERRLDPRGIALSPHQSAENENC